MSTPKTALFFTGTCRSLEYTYENLKKNLIDTIGECDIFVFLAENPHAHKFEKYLGNLPQVKKIIIEKEPEFDISNMKFRPNWPNVNSSRQIYIKMIKSRQRCNSVLEQHEQENDIKYERIIFSRLDVKYFGSTGIYLNNLDYDHLYVPDFHNTFGNVIDGYNDRFAVGNRRDMSSYFNVPDSIEQFNISGGLISAEALLKWHLVRDNVSVKKVPIRFTRVRGDGEEVDLRLASRALQQSDT